MNFDRREFLAAAAAMAGLPACAHAAASGAVRPEDFGARGDGRTNDTRAFSLLSDAINRRGGGTIALTAGKTYIVGAQSRGGKFLWEADAILELHHLSGPLRIIGNGARLRAQPGLKFGAFDPVTGAASQQGRGNIDKRQLAVAYRGMIHIHDCTGTIEISDVELDGNSAQLVVGGRYGDKGWQVPAHGLLLKANSGPETITNVYTHHHGTDGAVINGIERSSRSQVTKLVSRFNGRQGLSITGGSGYDFADCEFSHTGKAGIHSAPGAGVDIEAEGHRHIHDLTFTRCKFIDNTGCGMVADSGQSDTVSFTACTFVGTSSWSAWPHKPGFFFHRCTFVGSVVHPYGDPDPGQATRFIGCRFTDDPQLSAGGQVFTGSGNDAIVMADDAENVAFDSCTFDLVDGAVLPATRNAIYKDCTMNQHSQRPSRPDGRYLGRVSINGRALLTASIIEGTVLLNGRQLPRGRFSD